MFQTVEKPRVAALGLTLELYRDAFPGYMERLQAQFDRFLGEMDGLAVMERRRLCCRHEEIAAEIASAEAASLDALLIVPLSYTASMTSALSFSRTALPVIIWNTQEALTVDASYSHDDLVMNHVTQGTQDVTNVLVRAGKRFGMESAHYQDKAALARLGEWLRAARAARFARGARAGLLGQPFQDMGDFGVDETLMAVRWGPSVIRLSPSRLVALLREVEEGAVSEIVAQDQERFDISPEVTEEIHRISCRLELALRALVRENRLDALSMNFRELMSDDRLPTLPFFGLNKLLGEGLGYAGEGNAVTAAHMAQVRQLCGIANFTEIYTVDFVRNRGVMTHMQECNPALARRDRKIRLVRKEFWAPGVSPYVGMHFTLEPGPVTLSTVTTDAGGEFYYLTYETRIPDMEPFASFDIPHWLIELNEPIGDFLTRYSLAGGTHHLVSTPGHHASGLRKLACLQGFECRGI
ncbi:MAG: hypothetical protein HY321_08540 [Armatimonadetes bacterium]|nr:hypothetical protein [Armatimonadota bacterium]